MSNDPEELGIMSMWDAAECMRDLGATLPRGWTPTEIMIREDRDRYNRGWLSHAIFSYGSHAVSRRYFFLTVHDSSQN